jgi:hypothetical protein
MQPIYHLPYIKHSASVACDYSGLYLQDLKVKHLSSYCFVFQVSNYEVEPQRAEKGTIKRCLDTA